MKVKCKSTYPSGEQLQSLGPNFYRAQGFGISVGTEYLVFGLSFEFNSSVYGTGPYVHIQEDSGHFVQVPICLFEVTDNRASKYWRLKSWEDSAITLWPISFYKEYYADDLSEGVADVREDFNRVHQLIEAEANQEEVIS